MARELGIPAVVGCGDATARLPTPRLATGDRVRVDGALGQVSVLQRRQPPDGAAVSGTLTA